MSKSCLTTNKMIFWQLKVLGKQRKKKTVLLGKGPPFFWAKPWGSSHENIRSYPWNIGC